MYKPYTIGFAVLIVVVFVVSTYVLNGTPNSVNQNTASYSVANTAAKQAVYNNIIGVQGGQTGIPNGTAFYYKMNSEVAIASGTTYINGELSIFRDTSGNLKTHSNSTVNTSISGSQKRLTEESYTFFLQNNTYICASIPSVLNMSCFSLNISMSDLTSSAMNGLKINSLNLIDSRNTTYMGYPCLFTHASFNMSLNMSNTSGTLIPPLNENFIGTESSCYSYTYKTSLESTLNGTVIPFTSTSGYESNVFYNVSLINLSQYSTPITYSDLPANVTAFP